jgi:hypothetical protein
MSCVCGTKSRHNCATPHPAPAAAAVPARWAPLRLTHITDAAAPHQHRLALAPAGRVQSSARFCAWWRPVQRQWQAPHNLVYGWGARAGPRSAHGRTHTAFCAACTSGVAHCTRARAPAHRLRTVPGVPPRAPGTAQLYVALAASGPVQAAPQQTLSVGHWRQRHKGAACIRCLHHGACGVLGKHPLAPASTQAPHATLQEHNKSKLNSLMLHIY